MDLKLKEDLADSLNALFLEKGKERYLKPVDRDLLELHLQRIKELAVLNKNDMINESFVLDTISKYVDFVLNPTQDEKETIHDLNGDKPTGDTL